MPLLLPGVGEDDPINPGRTLTVLQAGLMEVTERIHSAIEIYLWAVDWVSLSRHCTAVKHQHSSSL